MQTATTDCLLRPREAAEWLKISARSLWTLTQRGDLPAVRIGRSVRYHLSDLVRFIETRKCGVRQ
jgi:excisionase family DNA binding protein